MHVFPNLLTACKSLLIESTAIANACQKPYVILGGWNPFLFNQGRIRHPGTRDVDILFEDGVKQHELRSVFEAFLQSGYFPSAKHEFQLLKILNVDGTEFVFNVDFLHASEEVSSSDFFVDHLRLPVPLSEYCEDEYYEKSIPVPWTTFIFEGFLRERTVEGLNPTGQPDTVLAAFPTEAAFVVSKTGSVGGIKRQRDALDVFITLAQSEDYAELVRQFKLMFQDHRSEFNTLYRLKEVVGDSRFLMSLWKYMPPDMVEGGQRFTEFMKYVDVTFNNFYKDIEMPEKAQAPWP